MQLSSGNCRLNSLWRVIGAQCCFFGERQDAAACRSAGNCRDDGFCRRRRKCSGDHAQVQPLSWTGELLPGRRGGAVGEGARDQDERSRKGGDPQRDIAARQDLRAGQSGKSRQRRHRARPARRRGRSSSPAARSSSCHSSSRTRRADHARCGICTRTGRSRTNTRTTRFSRCSCTIRASSIRPRSGW